MGRLRSKDVIEAAGLIVWREYEGKRQLAVIHRKRYDDWSLPKGKLKPDEDWIKGAKRETREETGCKAKPTRFAGCLCYSVGGTPKLVMFWEADLIEQGKIKDGGEGCSLHWMTLKQALKTIDYGDERQLLENLGNGHHRF